MFMHSIYFDYNATTPLDTAVREAMMPFLGEVWGYPNTADPWTEDRFAKSKLPE